MQDFLNFINKAKTQYHATYELSQILRKEKL